MTVVAQAFVLTGAILVCISSLGTVRFSNALARLHALTKAATLGIILILVGAIAELGTLSAASSLGLAALLQLLTSSLSGSLLGRATFRAELKSQAGDQQAAVARLGEDVDD